MAKKSKPVIATRRPPPVTSTEALDRFIHGDVPEVTGGVQEHPETLIDAYERPQTFTKTSVSTSERPETSGSVRSQEQSKARGLVQRLDGKDRRRRTIYLPPELDQRLEVWCVEQGREVSHAVAEAVRKMLAGKR